MIFSRRASKDSAPRRRTVVPPTDVSSRGRPLDSGLQFKRNQTLSGVRRKPEELSERAQAHRLAQHRRKIGSIFLLSVSVVIVLTFLVFQFTARVVVNASSQPLSRSIDSQQYETIINDYFGVQPVERLRFVLNEAGLSAYVAQRAPEVERVALTSTSNVVESNFTLTLREPVAGWQINGNQYYVDDNGVVFQENYYRTTQVQIVDQSGATPEQGSTVASTRLLSFVGRVVAQSREEGYTVTEVTLPVGTTRQIEVRLNDVRPYVKLTIDREAGEQVEDMARSLNYFDEENITPQYLDVRVSGRAAYK